MGRQPLFSIAALAVSVIVVFLAPLAGQESDYTPARTPWGDPDLRGHYLPGTSQPLETPRLEPWGDTQYTGHNYTFSRFFRPEGDAPARPRERVRTPMIIDPPDGRVPLQEWAAERRDEIMERQEELALLDPRVKCLPAAVPRAHLPVGYNTYQILQVPGAVIFLYEWNHHSRYVPLDGRPHVAAAHQARHGRPARPLGGQHAGHRLDELHRQYVAGRPRGAARRRAGQLNQQRTRRVPQRRAARGRTLHAGGRRTRSTTRRPSRTRTCSRSPGRSGTKGLKRAPEGHILYEYACHEGNGRNLKLMTGTDFQ